MKRLLFITERFPPDIGGLARSAQRITTTLCQLGIAVDVITWSRYLQPGEVVPEVLPVKDSVDTGVLQVQRIGLYRQWDMTLPQTLTVMEWLHQNQSYDAVWGHYLFPAGFLATWFAQLHQLPCLVSARGNDIDRTLFPPGDFARLQWTLARATWVTAVSQDMAHKIQVLSSRNDVVVLKNAVDDTLFAPTAVSPSASLSQLRAALGIAADEVVLGFSGELREKKGQQFLLQALATVQAYRPACLLIIGEVRASTQTLLQSYAIAHPEAAQRILITGHLNSPEAVAQHLRLCDVYLQPSLWEGMPNALLEAMACGCCCIASDAGGIPEVIEQGKQGFLLPRAHLHRLGEAVLELLLEPQIVAAVGVAARDRIQREYSLKQEQIQLQALMMQLMGDQ